jgi:hypothetical protein
LTDDGRVVTANRRTAAATTMEDGRSNMMMKMVKVKVMTVGIKDID